MFVVNLPVDLTEREMRLVFGRWGVVEEIDLGNGRSGGEVLENAVRGLPVDENEDEDDEDKDEDVQDDGERKNGNGDGANHDNMNSEKEEPKFQGHKETILPRSKRPRRKPFALPPSVPDLIPLPPLNPRQTPYGLSGLRTAKIVYLDAISLTRLFSSDHKPITIPKNKDPLNPTGLEYYIKLHVTLRPSLSSIKAHADSALARHDHLHSLLLSSRAKAHGAGALVDEDGFTVVVRGGRYGRTGGRGDGVGKLGVGVAKRGFGGDLGSVGGVEGKKKSRGAEELLDFYKFQSTDRKRQGRSTGYSLAVSWFSLDCLGMKY